LDIAQTNLPRIIMEFRLTIAGFNVSYR